MKQAINDLVKHSFVYAIGGIASKGVAILLIPLYTKYLTTSDYAVLQICNIVTAMLILLLNAGMNSSLFKVYYSKACEERDKVFSSVFIFFLIYASLLSFIFILLTPFVSKILIGGSNSNYVLIIVIAAAYLESISSILLSRLRAEKKSIIFVISMFLKILFNVGLNIILVTQYKRNYTGVREAVMISVFISILFLIPFTLRKISLKIDKATVIEVVKLGIPIAFAGFATWILNLTDRFMLKYLLPEQSAMHQVGLYSLGDKLSTILRFILVQPFMLSWGALMFSYQHDPRAKEIFSKVFNYYVVVALILYLLTSMFSKELVYFLSSSEAFYDSYRVIPILTGSKVLAGIYMIFTVGVTLTNNTKFMAYSTLIAAVLNVFFNFALIPKFGMIGAAFASLLAYIMQVTILYHFAQKVYKINYEILKALLYSFLILLIVFTSSFLGFIWVIKLILVLIVIALIPLTKIVTYDQVFGLMNFYLKKLRKADNDD